MIYAYAIAYLVIAAGLFGMLTHYLGKDPRNGTEYQFKSSDIWVLALCSLLWPLSLVAGFGYHLAGGK